MKKLVNLKGVKTLNKNEQKITFGGMMNTCGIPGDFVLCICRERPDLC